MIIIIYCSVFHFVPRRVYAFTAHIQTTVIVSQTIIIGNGHDIITYHTIVYSCPSGITFIGYQYNYLSYWRADVQIYTENYTQWRVHDLRRTVFKFHKIHLNRFRTKYHTRSPVITLFGLPRRETVSPCEVPNIIECVNKL